MGKDLDVKISLEGGKLCITKQPISFPADIRFVSNKITPPAVPVPGMAFISALAEALDIDPQVLLTSDVPAPISSPPRLTPMNYKCYDELWNDWLNLNFVFEDEGVQPLNGRIVMPTRGRVEWVSL